MASKMKLCLLPFIVLILTATVHSQSRIEDCTINIDDRLFHALRSVLSGGNRCMIGDDGIGPYQISQEYYDEAVEYNRMLRAENAYEFVWGSDSKNFSEDIVRSYICKHGMIVKERSRRQLSRSNIAAIHKGGSANNTALANRQFGRTVNAMYFQNLSADPTPLVCDPPCRPGQCCNEDGECDCIDTNTRTVAECEEQCESVEGLGGLDLVFVLDGSGSIGSENFQEIRESLERIVRSRTIGRGHTRVGVIVFGDDANIIFNLNRYSDTQSLVQGIRAIPYLDQYTYTDEALALLRTSAVNELLGLGPRFETVKVAVVITDGHSSNSSSTRTQADLLRRETEFQVFAVGVGDNINRDELMDIATGPSFVILLDDFSASQFQRFEDQIEEQTCTISAPLMSDETMVDRTLGQNRVARYRVRIPEEGFTLMFDVESGRVLLCGSRVQSPDCRDASTYEWRCVADSYCDIHVRGSSRKRRQASSEFMFVSIEGIETNNEVTVQTMTGDETISDAVSPIAVTDTIISLNDPLYEVPVTHTPPGMDTTTTSLCYQVHGESGKYYNLISDECMQMNALYQAFKNFENENFIKEIGLLIKNSEDNCTEISLRANLCSPVIDGIPFNESYDEDEITIINTGKRRFEITVPNCKATEADDIKFEIACHKTKGQKVIQFNIERGGGIKPGAHGIVGQFWNVPVHVLNYTGNYSGSTNNTYIITVDHPDASSPLRRFIGELHPATWDGKRKQCLYVGSAQSGAINEVDVPNDHVIEGTYDNYEVSGLFDLDFQYNKFQEDQCA